jgi:hypothetical protein
MVAIICEKCYYYTLDRAAMCRQILDSAGTTQHQLVNIRRYTNEHGVKIDLGVC